MTKRFQTTENERARGDATPASSPVQPEEVSSVVPDSADEHDDGLARPEEYGGRKGPDPVRYGDWEKNGRCIDF